MGYRPERKVRFHLNRFTFIVPEPTGDNCFGLHKWAAVESEASHPDGVTVGAKYCLRCGLVNYCGDKIRPELFPVVLDCPPMPKVAKPKPNLKLTDEDIERLQRTAEQMDSLVTAYAKVGIAYANLGEALTELGEEMAKLSPEDGVRDASTPPPQKQTPPGED